VHDDDVWYVGRLMVAPDLQRQGLGTTLMDRIEALAPARARVLRLVTGLHSEVNLRFYRRRGYREVGRRSHPGVDVVVMERPLRRG